MLYLLLFETARAVGLDITIGYSTHRAGFSVCLISAEASSERQYAPLYLSPLAILGCSATVIKYLAATGNIAAVLLREYALICFDK